MTMQRITKKTTMMMMVTKKTTMMMAVTNKTAMMMMMVTTKTMLTHGINGRTNVNPVLNHGTSKPGEDRDVWVYCDHIDDKDTGVIIHYQCLMDQNPVHSECFFSS